MMRALSAALVVLIVLAAMGYRVPPRASAHAILVRSDPQAGATLEEPPPTIELWFSEGLASELTDVRLLSGDGQTVDGVMLTFNEADDKQVSVAVPELARGSYVVAWSSFSTVDGHRLDGSFSFGFGVAPSGESSAAIAPDFTPSVREVGSRWVHLVGLLALAGVTVVALLVGPPKPGDDHPLRVLVLVGMAAAILLALGDVGALLVRADRAGGFDKIGEVIGGSDWGAAWVWRIFLSVAALPLLALLLSLRARWYRRMFVIIAVLAAGAMLAESSASHAAARSSALPAFADFVHLLASGAWIGAVVGLAATMLWSRRDTSGVRRVLVADLLRRFAFVAVLSFGLILITGIYRTVQEVPSLRAFVDTTYGKALSVKLGLVMVVLALGAANFLLVRRWWGERSTSHWRTLLRSIPAEAMVGTAVVAAVALLTVATPAASLGPQLARGDSSEIGSVVRQRAAGGDLEVELTVSPSDTGRVRVSASFLRTQSTRDRPLSDDGLAVTQVRFRFKPVDGSIGEARVIAQTSDDETWAVEGPYLPFKGEWSIQVDVRRRGADDVSAKFVYDTERDQRPAYVRVLDDETIVFSIAQDSGDPNLLLAGAGGDGIYRSTDGGRTWQGPSRPGAYRVVAASGRAGAFYAGGEGLSSTSDGGISWQPLFQEENNTVWDVALSPVDPGVIVIATRRGIYQSADRGSTWTLRLPTVPRADASPGAADDEWSDLAVGPDGTFVTGRRPGILAVSRDGGASWDEISSNLDLPGGVMSLMIDRDDPSRWFVGSMGSGVWSSDDGGRSWTQANIGVSPNGHGAGFAKGRRGETLVATTGQGVLETENGVDWVPVGDDAIELDIAEEVFITTAGDDRATVLVGGIGIYRLELEGQ